MDIPIDYEKLLNELRITREKSLLIDPASKRFCTDMEELQQALNTMKNKQIAKSLPDIDYYDFTLLLFASFKNILQ